jgi:hypothetical protein
MTPAQELDLKVAAESLGRSIEEIVFCTLHPQLTGPHRRDVALRGFAEAVVCVVKRAALSRPTPEEQS